MATDRQQIRNDHPDSWVAVEPGDFIKGTVTDVTEAWSDQRNNLKGGFYPLLWITATEAPGYTCPQDLKVHGFSSVLFSEIMRHKPEVGETVVITYRGLGKERKGNPPALYTVKVEGRKDQAARAYGRITNAEKGQQAGVTIAPTVPPEPEPEQDDDIPF